MKIKTNKRIKVVEKVKISLQWLLQRYDPFKKDSCVERNCFECISSGEKKSQNVKFKVECKNFNSIYM